MQKIEPGEADIVLFRKRDTQERQIRIFTSTMPPVLSEEKLIKLCKNYGGKDYFEEGNGSYYQTYRGQAVVAFYFKNKFLAKSIEVKQELKLKNMMIRGMNPSSRTVKFKLLPNDRCLVIVDAVERD